MAATWTSHRTSANNFRVTVNLDRMEDDFSVMLMSDVHLDNPHCDRRMFKRHLDLAVASNMPILIIGDLFDAMQGKHDKRSYKSDLLPEYCQGDYLDQLVNVTAEWLHPYRNHIALLALGNHETGVLKHNETDLMGRLGEKLGTDVVGAYGGYVAFEFRYSGLLRCRSLLKYFHGNGGGGPVTRGAIGMNRRQVMYPDADFIVTGHCHDRVTITYVTERYNTKSGRTELRPCEHIQLAGYKEEHGEGLGGYHVESGRPPKPLGSVQLRFKLHTEREMGTVYRAVGTAINHTR